MVLSEKLFYLITQIMIPECSTRGIFLGACPSYPPFPSGFPHPRHPVPHRTLTCQVVAIFHNEINAMPGGAAKYAT